jgi:hypothetical protein
MVLPIAAFIYICAALFLLQVLSARVGYEDENGFHFSDPMEDLVVTADEVRPAWFTGALAERFSSQRVEIFAGIDA